MATELEQCVAAAKRLLEATTIEELVIQEELDWCSVLILG
jgi:hypothetical protein